MNLIYKIKINALKRRKIKSETRKIALKKAHEITKLVVVIQNENAYVKTRIKEVFSNAEIHVLTIRDKKLDESENDLFTLHFADFNLTGQLKNDKLKRLQQHQFDLIIDLSSNLESKAKPFRNANVELLRCFTQTIQAQLIIGMLNKENNEWCDILVESGNSPIDFIQNIEKQLNLLTK